MYQLLSIFFSRYPIARFVTEPWRRFHSINGELSLPSKTWRMNLLWFVCACMYSMQCVNVMSCSVMKCHDMKCNICVYAKFWAKMGPMIGIGSWLADYFAFLNSVFTVQITCFVLGVRLWASFCHQLQSEKRVDHSGNVVWNLLRGNPLLIMSY